jgi:hypothetical protein
MSPDFEDVFPDYKILGPSTHVSPPCEETVLGPMKPEKTGRPPKAPLMGVVAHFRPVRKQPSPLGLSLLMRSGPQGNGWSSR